MSRVSKQNKFKNGENTFSRTVEATGDRRKKHKKSNMKRSINTWFEFGADCLDNDYFRIMITNIKRKFRRDGTKGI